MYGISMCGLIHKSNQIQLHKYFDKLGLSTFCENGTFNPRKSGSPSGRGTFRNSSTPTQYSANIDLLWLISIDILEQPFYLFTHLGNTNNQKKLKILLVHYHIFVSISRFCDNKKVFGQRVNG